MLNYDNLDLKVAWYNWKEILILWCKAVVRVVRLEWQKLCSTVSGLQFQKFYSEEQITNKFQKW